MAKEKAENLTFNSNLNHTHAHTRTHNSQIKSRRRRRSQVRCKVYIAENDLRRKQFALHFTAHSIALRIFYIFYILCIWKWLLRLCAGGCELSECMCYCLWSTSFLLRCLFPLAYGKCVLCIRFSRFFFNRLSFASIHSVLAQEFALSPLHRMKVQCLRLCVGEFR